MLVYQKRKMIGCLRTVSAGALPIVLSGLCNVPTKDVGFATPAVVGESLGAVECICFESTPKTIHTVRCGTLSLATGRIEK